MAAPDDGDDTRHDNAYRSVLAELSRLSEAWRIHRDVVNRAISMLNQEVIGFQKRLDEDDKARAERQQQLDSTLSSIVTGQQSIRTWQTIRLCIELAAIFIIIAFLIGRSF